MRILLPLLAALLLCSCTSSGSLRGTGEAFCIDLGDKKYCARSETGSAKAEPEPNKELEQ